MIPMITPPAYPTVECHQRKGRKKARQDGKERDAEDVRTPVPCLGPRSKVQGQQSNHIARGKSHQRRHSQLVFPARSFQTTSPAPEKSVRHKAMRWHGSKPPGYHATDSPLISKVHQNSGQDGHDTGRRGLTAVTCPFLLFVAQDYGSSANLGRHPHYFLERIRLRREKTLDAWWT